jgi:hypothetical protein
LRRCICVAYVWLISWYVLLSMEHVVSLQVSFVEHYVHQILNHDEDSKNSSLSKNFWKYIKSRKKDSMGISPLQNLPGMYIRTCCFPPSVFCGTNLLIASVIVRLR